MIADIMLRAVVSKFLNTISVQYLADILDLLYICILV